MKVLMYFIFLFVLVLGLPAQTKVCVDAGHGGSDPGATGHGLLEKNVNLDVSNRLVHLLQNAGYKPYLTRSNDSTVSLASRTSYANSIGAHRFISVHCNAFNGSAHGTETFCYTSGSNTSFRMRDKTNPLLVDALNTFNRGCKTANFYVIKNTNMPAILAELAFIDNAADSAKLADGNYRQRAAQALLQGLQQAGREEEIESSSLFYMAPRWVGEDLVVKSAGSDTLSLLSVASGQRQYFSEIAREESLVSAEDGILWIGSGDEKQVLRKGTDVYFNCVVSPDQTMVAYEGLTTGLHVTFLKNKAHIALGQGNHPSWTPDSAKIVFDCSTDNGQEITSSDLCAVSIQNPAQRINLTQRGSFLSQRPSVSPDGKKIAFDAQGKIYIAELGENFIKNCQEVVIVD